MNADWFDQLSAEEQDEYFERLAIEGYPQIAQKVTGLNASIQEGAAVVGTPSSEAERVARYGKSELEAYIQAFRDECNERHKELDPEYSFQLIDMGIAFDEQARTVETLCHALEHYAGLDGKGNENIRAAAYVGIKLGIAYQQLLVRKDVARAAAQTNPNLIRHQESSKRNEAIVQRFHELFPNEVEKKTSVYRRIAKKFGLSEKRVGDIVRSSKSTPGT